MKKRILLAVFAALTLVSLNNASVFAWSFSVSGKAVCNTTTGEWDLTWTITNPEDEELTVKESDRPSVPVGSKVGVKTSKDFKESLPGTTTGEQSLTVKVEWPSDKKQPAETAKVKLEGTCKKTVTEQPPTEPPAGGRGGGTVDAPVQPTTPQVKAKPTGKVVAGEGSPVVNNVAASAGLIGSVTLFCVAMRHFNKQLF